MDTHSNSSESENLIRHNAQAQAAASETQTHPEQTASEPLPAAPCSARPVVPWSEVIIDLQNDITTSEIAQIAMALVTPGRLSEFQLKRLSELPDSAKRHFWIGNYRLSEIQIQTQEKRNLSWRSSRIGGLFSSLLRRLGWPKKKPSPSGQRPQEGQISK